MGVSHRGIRKGDLGGSGRQRGIGLLYKQGQAIDKGDTWLGCTGVSKSSQGNFCWCEQARAGQGWGGRTLMGDHHPYGLVDMGESKLTYKLTVPIPASNLGS